MLNRAELVRFSDRVSRGDFNWTDRGHLVISPPEFMQRLAALVPRPRLHLIRFHGVLAPSGSCARWRSGICFFFDPNDLLQEGAMLEIVLDLPWVEASDDAAQTSNFNTVNASLSRPGGVIIGIQGPTITHFNIDHIQQGQFEPVRLVPGAFDGRVLDLNSVPLPSSVWQVLLGLAAMGWVQTRRRPALQRWAVRMGRPGPHANSPR